MVTVAMRVKRARASLGRRSPGPTKSRASFGELTWTSQPPSGRMHMGGPRAEIQKARSVTGIPRTCTSGGRTAVGVANRTPTCCEPDLGVDRSCSVFETRRVTGAVATRRLGTVGRVPRSGTRAVIHPSDS